MNSPIALESLLQRGRTPLFNELVSVYQESFDALLESPRASGKEVNLTLKSLGFIEKIKNTVKDVMNIPISKVIVMESLHPNAMAFFDGFNRKIPSVKNKSMTFGMVMQKIENLYDDKTAVLDNDNSKLDFTFKLGITTSFWSIRNKDKSFYFTPEELAAITLHELGHFDHWIRTYGRIHAKIIDASEIVTYVKAHPDKDTILEILKRVRESNILDKSWTVILNNTENYFRKTNSFEDQEHLEALNIVATLVSVGLSNYTLTKFNMVQDAYYRPKTVGHTSSGIKDLILDAERSADEFAARNGAYEYLVSGLLKFTELYQNKTNLLLAQRSLYKNYFFFQSLKEFNIQFDYYAEDVMSGYDPIIRRVELIVETAKHAFSDANLPTDVRSDLIEQIKQSETYIKEYKSANRSLIRDKFKAWVNAIEKFGRILKSPFENRVQGDYDKLHEATRHLSRNPLHYIAKS